MMCEYMCRCACTWWGEGISFWYHPLSVRHIPPHPAFSCLSSKHFMYHVPTWIFFLFRNILCIWAFYLHICICTTLKPGAQGGQKRSLQTTVNYHMGAWTGTVQSLSSQSSSSLNHLSIPPLLKLSLNIVLGVPTGAVRQLIN